MLNYQTFKITKRRGSFKVTVDLQRAFRKMLRLRAALKKTVVDCISLES